MLRDNQIKEVPPELAYCSDLQQLHLQMNQINVLPVEFGETHHFIVQDLWMLWVYVSIDCQNLLFSASYSPFTSVG